MTYTEGLPAKYFQWEKTNVRLSAISQISLHAVLSLLCPALLMIMSGDQAAAQSTVVQSTTPAVTAPVATVSGQVCPKCGRVHGSARPVATASPAKSVSATPVRTVAQVAYQKASNGVQNVLGMLNNQRSRQGLRTLRYDPALQSVAERRARQMASMGLKSHPPGSFAPGRYEGVGWSSSFSPSGVSACYTSDPRMTAAGAAMVAGRDGVYFAVVYR
ncbi:CAP domain-containing protein [Stieleria maiorica]|uniref:CAP domain-containing protein n=1 Tax=Stieleria maiorica TaxID=2795974 RepID=UPI001F3261C3|nr:CAP domain-containing protein [Stieleria maiorica]